MSSRTKLAMGMVLVVLIVGTVAVTAYAAPLETQDRIRQRDQLGDPNQCPNFVDEDGDGICDNCRRQQGEGYGRHSQNRHGWRS